MTKCVRIARIIIGMVTIVTATTASAGDWLQGSYPEYGWPRNYAVYLPTGVTEFSDARPMILFLHGCQQTAIEFARSARLEKMADEKGVILLLPEQTNVRNPQGCWNWFQPFHQGRAQGEPGSLAALVTYVQARLPVDIDKTYVAGLSAGGAMANVLVSCYPDVFAGAAIHSGMSYRAAHDVWSANYAFEHGSTVSPAQSAAWAYQCSGQQSISRPMILLHGSEDRWVSPLNTQQIESQAMHQADWADDGMMNQSPAWGDPRRTSEQVMEGYAYTVDEYVYGGKPHIKRVTVQGLAHAWSGGDANYRFTDPKGPDFTLMLADFFEIKR